MQIFHVAEATLNAKNDRRTPETVVKCKFSVSRATLSSLRARRTSKTVVKCKIFELDGQPFFITSGWSEVRNCGKTMIFLCRGQLPTPCAHFIHFCARRCSETCIFTFWMARRCSETHIWILPDEPSRRIRWVDRAKLWRNVNFELLESLRALAWACERLCFVSARCLRALHLLSQSFERGRPRKFASRIGR